MTIELKIGIVGAAGKIGSVHFGGLLKLRESHPDLKIAIQTTNEAVRNGDLTAVKKNNLGVELPESFDPATVDAYETVEELLADPEITLVIIAAPTEHHVEIALAAVRAGKHVLVEKPISLDPEEARGLKRVADSCGKLVLVGQILPRIPEFAWLLDAVKSKRFGRLISLQLYRHVHTTDPVAKASNRSACGGPIVDLGIHDAHCAILADGEFSAVHGSFLGKPSHPLSARLQLCSPRGNYIGIETGAIPLTGTPFRHGFTAHFRLSDVTTTAMFGSDGCPLRVFQSNNQALTFPEVNAGNMLTAFISQLEHAIGLVDGSKLSEGAGALSVDAAIGALELILAGKQAVLTGSVVHL